MKNLYSEAFKKSRGRFFILLTFVSLFTVSYIIYHLFDDFTSGLFAFIFAFLSISFLFPYIDLFFDKVREIKAEETARTNLKKGVYGSARWATEEDLSKAGMNEKRGIALDFDVYYPRQEGHILTAGVTRSGKGNLVMLNLLQNTIEGSIIAIDPKGEITAVTAQYQRSLGKEVHIIDPWGIVENRTGNKEFRASSYNPLDVLDPDGDDLPSDCASLSEMLFPSNPKKDDHWSNSARNWLSYFLYYIKTELKPEKQNLRHLAKILRLPFKPVQEGDASLLGVLTHMATSEGKHAEINHENANELIGMLSGEDKEGKSILSSSRPATNIFRSPALAKATSKSDFKIADITNGNMVIYVCIPADKLAEFSLYLRILIGSFIKAVQRNYNKNVLMILDEFYTLGYLREIAENMGQMSGYHLQLWPIIQDFNQLKERYGDAWETFIANAPCRILTGVDDQTSAEYITKQLGTYTKAKYSLYDGQLDNEKSRDLLNPLEVRNHKNNIVFTRDAPPISAKKTRYWEHPVFSKRAGSNPFVS